MTQRSAMRWDSSNCRLSAKHLMSSFRKDAGTGGDLRRAFSDAHSDTHACRARHQVCNPRLQKRLPSYGCSPYSAVGGCLAICGDKSTPSSSRLTSHEESSRSSSVSCSSSSSSSHQSSSSNGPSNKKFSVHTRHRNENPQCVRDGSLTTDKSTRKQNLVLTSAPGRQHRVSDRGRRRRCCRSSPHVIARTSRGTGFISRCRRVCRGSVTTATIAAAVPSALGHAALWVITTLSSLGQELEKFHRPNM
jgi:hypothetical protein